MALERSQKHWLGLFVVGSLLVLVGLLVVIGGGKWGEASVAAHTFFGESVQGLDVGAPVKYRGVTIGKISHIGIDAELDIRVDMELFLEQIDLGETESLETFLQEKVDRGARCRIELLSISGLKYIQIDFLDQASESLSVAPVDGSYRLPSAPSLLADLTEDVSDAVKRLSAVDFADISTKVTVLIETMNALLQDERVGTALDNLVEIEQELQRLLETLNTHVTGKSVAAVLKQTTTTLAELQKLVQTANGQLEAADLASASEALQVTLRAYRTIPAEAAAVSQQAQRTLAQAGETLARVDQALESARVEALSAQAQATLQEAQQAITAVSGIRDDVVETRQELHTSLRVMAELADSLRQNPSAVVRGRIATETRPGAE